MEHREPEASAVVLARRVLESTPERWDALKKLATDVSAEADRQLLMLLRNADPYVRTAAVNAVSARKRHVPILWEAVHKALWDDSPHAVRAAINAQADHQDESQIDRLHELLGSKCSLTVETVCRALHRIGRAESFAPLFNLFERASEERTRREAAIALYAIVSAATWRQLFDKFVDDPLARHRTWSCRLVERFGGSEDLRRVLHLLDDPDGHVRKAAARATGS